VPWGFITSHMGGTSAAAIALSDFVGEAVVYVQGASPKTAAIPPM
jgi:hypothetical protein